ncbi:MAG: putative Ig domain-containing protein, partial [Candidatus Firestonebacteria bacterium]|nr:putative Ig domain-containing protein [Candidatus Firestonebacteria bacterium]
PDGDTLIYSAINLPPGATFDPNTRIFSWIPDFSQAKTYSITFTVSDYSLYDSLYDSESITISVNNSNRAPQLDHISNKSINENELLEFTVTASDPDNDTLSYFTGDLPQGASFDTTTHNFSWTPSYSQAGTYSVLFIVSDYSISHSETITITVNNVNRTPLLVPIGNKSINENELLEFTVTASDPDNDTLSYFTGDLPQGASFDTTTHNFSWTPSYSQAGTYSVLFIVSDYSLSHSETITITVNNINLTPEIINSNNDIKKKRICFITLASGRYIKLLKLLSNFRDTNLISNFPGKVITKSYYKISPRIIGYFRSLNMVKFYNNIL